jgi:hypothetical protein
MRTFTGPSGDYRIYRAAPGSATVQVAGVSSVVTLGTTLVKHDVSVAPKLIAR